MQKHQHHVNGVAAAAGAEQEHHPYLCGVCCIDSWRYRDRDRGCYRTALGLLMRGLVVRHGLSVASAISLYHLAACPCPSTKGGSSWSEKLGKHLLSQ